MLKLNSNFLRLLQPKACKLVSFLMTSKHAHVSLLRRIFLPSLSVAPALAAGLKKLTPGSPSTASSSTFLKAP